MPLKKHHKIMIGSFSSFLIILLIANSVFLYILYGKLQYDFNTLSNKIETLQTDVNSKINSLTSSILSTKKDVQTLSSEIGSIDQEFEELGQELDKVKASASEDFSKIIENSVKSVVTIRTDISQGTGFIIEEKGYIVTNQHVMEKATAAVVYTSDGESHRVQLIGENSELDVALLKIEGNYNELELGNSNKIEVGQKVIAIGNPLGLQFSVSEGIISGVHRPGPKGGEFYIQTDAALNPGNSGGPLINKQGEAIGINNFKIGTAESLGFALESNKLEDIVNDITSKALNQTLL